jgi:hypothetical protein
LLTWLVVIGTQDLSVESKLVVPVLMAMPFLALGARVETDGDVSSRRRKWVLGVLITFTVLEVLSWEGSVIALGVLSPLIALATYLAAGRSEESESGSLRRHS